MEFNLRENKVITIKETFKYKIVAVVLDTKEFLVTVYKNAGGYMFSECVCGATMKEFENVERFVSSKLNAI